MTSSLVNMHAIRHLGFIVGVSAVFSGAAIGADPKASHYYEDALKRFDSQDAAGAVLQLKNAIQQDRTMLAAQVLLGKALLLEGDPIGAEVAFEEALSQGVDRSEVILQLGQALLMQGKFDSLIQRLIPSGLSAGLRRDVLLLRAKAYVAKGNNQQAERSLEEARGVDPRSAKVRAAQGALMLLQGRVADAARLVDEIMAIAPDDASSWEFKASLLHAKGDANGALAAYAQVMRLSPRNVDARIARASLLIDQGLLAEATSDVAEILKIFPKDPRGAYFQALIAGRKGDLATAQEALKRVVNLLDPVPMAVLGANKQMLMMLSLAHFSLGNQEKAIASLIEFLRRYPGDVGAAKLLASIYLQKGQTSKVISILEPLKAGNSQDAKVFSLLAAANMTEGRYAQASRLLEESLRLSGPGAADIRTDFGLSLLGEGRSDLGLEHLQQAFAKDPSQTRAGVALATLLMRRGQTAKALEVAETLAKAQPNDLLALNLLGGVKGAAGDLAGSRRAYERILQVAPGHVPAILNIAKLDVTEGKLEAARLRLNALLKASPKNTDAMFELAQLEERAGNAAEAIRWLEKARVFPSGAMRAGLYLIDLYLRQRSFDNALSVAKDVTLKANGDLVALSALVRAQMAIGDLGAARRTLRDMTRFANFDAGAQVDIARMQRAAGNDSGAIYSLEKALSGTSGYLPALLMMAEIEIAQKDYAKAETRIKTLQQQQANDVSVARLQGDLLMARGQYAAAANVYRLLLGKTGGEVVILRLYRAYELSGERGRGLKALEEWSKAHPNDLVVMRVLGDGYLSADDPAGARRSYERLLSVRPDDPLVLNNLAQALLRQGDRTAVETAERAFRLSDRDATVIDTFGWVLVSQGQFERGVGLLRDARLRDPESREIRYHLAHALAKMGRLPEARDELRSALRDEAPFEGVAAARKLQLEIGK